MNKWLKYSLIGCGSIALAVVVAIAFIAISITSFTRGLSERHESGVHSLELTNGAYSFTEPEQIAFDGERFGIYFDAREEWRGVMEEKLPMAELKRLSDSAGDPGVSEMFGTMKELVEEMADGFNQLAEVLNRHEMSFEEYRWHTGQALCVLMAEPPISQELADIHAELRLEMEKMDAFRQMGQQPMRVELGVGDDAVKFDEKDVEAMLGLNASLLKQKYGFAYDAAKSSGAESLAGRKEQILKEGLPPLLLDMMTLNGSMNPGEVRIIGVQTEPE